MYLSQYISASNQFTLLLRGSLNGTNSKQTKICVPVLVEIHSVMVQIQSVIVEIHTVIVEIHNPCTCKFRTLAFTLYKTSD